MVDSLVLLSPLDGWSAPLSETPDPVFAENMLGDGLAIDPTTGVLRAPCDATILTVHAARHAVTLRGAGGLEMLLHVGLETVALAGSGFESHVAEGQQVKAGDLLLTFDLDRVAQRARSLISPMVITSGHAIRSRVVDRQVRSGEAVMEVVWIRQAAAEEGSAVGSVARRDVEVILAHGLHARPAARLAERARAFDAVLRLEAGDRSANARSPVALMSLGLKHGDGVTIIGEGADGEAAVAALAELMAGGMGEARAKVGAPAAAVTQPAGPSGRLSGVKAAPGLAVGRAILLKAADFDVPERGQDPGAERAALEGARAAVRGELQAQLGTARDTSAQQAILAAHLAFVDDPELTAAADRAIAAGKSAAFAWRAAVGGYVEALKRLGDRRMAERVDDLVDLERRVLAVLCGKPAGAVSLPQGTILLADDLLPSQLLGLEPGRVIGLCSARGGPTSHAAILAQALGLPALVAVGADLLAIPDGTSLVLDADAGWLQASPDVATLEAAQARLARRSERRRAARARASDSARLADGELVPVMANLGGLAEATNARAAGADGCGLLRTEFLFLDRDAAPNEDEQARDYQAIADALEGAPLVVRLLDVGGDKTAPYLPIGPEDNPALGVRGVRVLLRRPLLLRAQLRAILRVAPAGQCRIMAPMISRLSELRAIRAALDEARRDLGITSRVDLGVMIETPAAAMIADQLAAECDFLSIGTNDLTQYALAIDRGNSELAVELDALDPAVLRLVAQTVAGGRASALSTGVCGGAAGDLAAIPILLGLGVDRLSMPADVIPEAKALIRTLSGAACRKLAVQALAEPSAEGVRALSTTFLNGGA